MRQTEERPEYVNEHPRHEQNQRRETNQSERRIIQLLGGSFGVLCMLQAILNVTLRLALPYSNESTLSECNTTHPSDLMQRILALTRDKQLLENRITALNNMIKSGEEERIRLQIQLDELTGSKPSQKCPTSWREINSRCYFLSTESSTWEQSRTYCQSRGADLVVINSEQEQRALYRLNGEAVVLFWIGLRNMDGTFKWVDGSPLTDSFWATNQPNPNDGEDCVEMYHLNPELKNWNDVPCMKQQRWLCEKDPSTSA